jgi:hypothetical protein
MQQGVLVFFWQVGDRAVRGLHGWGELVSRPSRMPELRQGLSEVLSAERNA